MCGIAGVVSWDRDLRITRQHLANMSAHIAHRGPDGHDLWLDDSEPQAGFAFRRLAVLDPDPRAMQPMSTPDGRFTLVFNGEIYNFRELRTELSPRDWRSTGDAEVLLHALATWGEGALEKLNGMFAFALWDAHAKSLLLARDRMGQKPLYFTTGRRSMAFASERRALEAWPDWEQEIDKTALADYLRLGCIAAPRTLLTGAHQLLPGHYLKIDRFDNFAQESLVQMRYFDPNALIPNLTTSFRTLIERAVSRQLVSDVPLGVFLSGGVDSSVIALCARKSGAVKTFSIGFDDPRYDESAYAREVAEHLGTEHHEFRVTPGIASDLAALAGVFGDPFADSSALPTHYLARETRKHVTVALSGDGGDELFGGYDRYRAIGIPARLFRPLAPVGRRFARGHPKSRLTRLGRFLASASYPQALRYRSYIQIFSDSQIKLLCREPAPPDGNWARAWSELRRTRGPVEAAVAMDRTHYLPDDLLTKVDRAAMLHALEVRSPFMDHELIQRAAGLSRTELLGGGKKRVLRHAFSGDLPESVFARPKMGFAVPIGDWLRTSWRTMLHDHLFASTSFARQHFNMPVIEHLVAGHESGRADQSQRLYALLMLELSQLPGA
ncbi:MAG: asparagine synthase (glutamine-hydrolyzing) [Burkholderiales bacterium]|nr:asparagine synthase (glutamine-hydrolyzing) [Phycisphaerae bacterium]